MNKRRRDFETQFPGFSQQIKEIKNPASEANLATELYFAFEYNLTRAELLRNRPKNESQLTRDLLRTHLAQLRLKIPEVYGRMALYPDIARLCLAGRRLTFKDVPITAIQLASELGISRASFYRRYPAGLKSVLLAEARFTRDGRENAQRGNDEAAPDTYGSSFQEAD